MTGDESFICPAVNLARTFSQDGNKVYMYHFTHSSSTGIYDSPWLRASHAEEIPYIFGWHFLRHMEMRYAREEAFLALQIMNYWTNFVKTG